MSYTVSFNAEDHTYKLSSEEGDLAIPSVTTVLSKAFPKPALVKWAWKRGVEGSWKAFTSADPPKSAWELEHQVVELDYGVGYTGKSTSSMTRGTAIHTVAETFAREGAAAARLLVKELPQSQKGYGNAVLGWFASEEPEVISSELVVASAKHLFAGTTDLLAKRRADGGDKIILSDYKTGKAIYNEAKLQVSAYRLAYEEMTGTQIDGTSVIRLGYDGGWEEVECDADPGIFLSMLDVYNSGILDFKGDIRRAS